MPAKLNLPYHLIETQQKPTDKKRNLRYNAFTSKSYAKNTKLNEIGKPPRLKFYHENQYNSIFKKDYLNGKLPFLVDQSSLSMTNLTLAWKQSIQILDLSELLPIIIYGLGDCEETYSNIAQLSLTYILNHAHRRQIYKSLLFLKRPFKFIFRSRHKRSILLGLKALEKIITGLFYAGRILIPEYEKILSPLNIYLLGPEEKLCDDIFYGQWHKSFLSTSIENALRAVEKCATGPFEQYTAFSEIKKAVPLYESEMFPLKGKSKILHEKIEFNNDFIKQEFTNDENVKNLNLRLIDVNAM